MKRQLFPDVEGFLEDAEVQFLQKMCRGKSVLEVGCWKGRSTVAIAKVARRLVSVDHFGGDSFVGMVNPVELFTEFTRNLDANQIRTWLWMAEGPLFQVLQPLALNNRQWKSKVEVVAGSFAWSRALLPTTQVVIYDGEHTGEATGEFLAWTLGLPRDTTILVHDYDQRPQYTDAVNVVDSFAMETGRRIAAAPGTHRYAIL